jgi:2-polyprenyl-3-methyl-5-hydroxy-6-metoxy-1,4-benzoquinol methylase
MNDRMSRDNAEARAAWQKNAHYWDERMGEGNDFFEILVWPATEQLLSVRTGDRVLDVACGNGLTARRLVKAGARVTAFDFSDELIAIARKRSEGFDIAYQVLDATDFDALVALGDGQFDAALRNMALMDVADVVPLFAALARLLRPGGRVVFSVCHPCFNNPASIQVGEQEDRNGTLTTTYSVKVTRYLTAFTRPGLAMRGQPVPHPYFHRSLSELLRAAFKAGFVLDALEERAFPRENTSGAHPLSWNGRFSELPPALIARMILPGDPTR